MKPTLGMNVHYTDESGVTLAAIVVKVNPDSPHTVNLTIFGERGGQVLGVNSVQESTDTHEESCEVGTWHWPPKE